MKKYLLPIFSLLLFACSSVNAPELRFTESEFNNISGANGKTYEVIEAVNTSNNSETPLDYSTCHTDDVYQFKDPISFVITVGEKACYYQDPPIQLASSSYEYLPLTGDIQIHTQRHEQDGDEVFRLTYSLYLERIEPSGNLVFVGRDQHVGRRLVLREIQ